MKRSSSQGAALALAAKISAAIRVKTSGQWGSCADVRWNPSQGAALAVAAKAHDIVEVHRVAAYLSEEITRKTTQAMGIATTGRWESCEASFWAKGKRQVVLQINGPVKTGSDGVGGEHLGVKSGEDESIGRRGAPQLEVQKLELKQQRASREHKQKTQEAPPDPEEGTPDLEKETREAPSAAEEKHERWHGIPRRRHKSRHRILKRRQRGRCWIPRRNERRRRILRRRHGRRRRIPRRRQEIKQDLQKGRWN